MTEREQPNRPGPIGPTDEADRRTRVLVIDDDPSLVLALRINLTARQYVVATAGDGRSALRTAAEQQPDLVLLDLGLPDMDGVEVIGGLRGWTRAPIIVLSGRAGSGDKVDALDAGADDYVTKPFSIAELLARIRAVSRRSGAADAGPVSVRIGRHTVDLTNHSITGPDGEVRLTPTEWHLLEILARNPDKLIPRRQLLRQVWGPQYETETNYLRQYMAQLRRKLEDDVTHPRHLITEPGMGYRYRA